MKIRYENIIPERSKKEIEFLLKFHEETSQDNPASRR